MHRPLQVVRRSQSMGVHPRLGRGDAASGLSSCGGRFQARREMTRMEFGELALKLAWDLELVPASNTCRFSQDAGGITAISRWLSEATPPDAMPDCPAS
jgi:hypothetical protein